MTFSESSTASGTFSLVIWWGDLGFELQVTFLFFFFFPDSCSLDFENDYFWEIVISVFSASLSKQSNEKAFGIGFSVYSLMRLI